MTARLAVKPRWLLTERMMWAVKMESKAFVLNYGQRDHRGRVEETASIECVFCWLPEWMAVIEQQDGRFDTKVNGRCDAHWSNHLYPAIGTGICGPPRSIYFSVSIEHECIRCMGKQLLLDESADGACWDEKFRPVSEISMKRTHVTCAHTRTHIWYVWIEVLSS